MSASEGDVPGGARRRSRSTLSACSHRPSVRCGAGCRPRRRRRCRRPSSSAFRTADRVRMRHREHQPDAGVGCGGCDRIDHDHRIDAPRPRAIGVAATARHGFSRSADGAGASGGIVVPGLAAERPDGVVQRRDHRRPAGVANATAASSFGPMLPRGARRSPAARRRRPDRAGRSAPRSACRSAVDAVDVRQQQQQRRPELAGQHRGGEVLVDHRLDARRTARRVEDHRARRRRRTRSP